MEDLIDACLMRCYVREQMAARNLLSLHDLAPNLRAFAPSREKPNIEECSAIVVDCAYKPRVEAGPGLLETVCEVALASVEQRELQRITGEAWQSAEVSGSLEGSAGCGAEGR